ncbi:MAG: protein translocase subunit SecD [Clostridia bacterium]|nr:protein translocase subunit SecD [Clostridia bacterium]
MSKRKSIVILTVLAILIAFMGFACFASGPVPGSVKDYKGIFGVIGKGIDLNGGYYAVLEPKEEIDGDVDSILDAAIETLRSRLDENGYTEATITVEDFTNLRVEIPEVDNADDVMELIGDQGELTFRAYDNTPLVYGDKAVANAQAGYDTDGNPVVYLEFTADGQKMFASATETVLGYEESNRYLAIYLGERAISSPKVSQKIDSRTAEITGIETIDEAKTIASVIKSGSLNIQFTIGATQKMSATLGEGVLNNAIIAAGIGLLIIFAILIFFYGGMGIAASIALTVYVILYVCVLAVFPWVQLTFPGIAGIVLSIGMAVDANVIIFDRIKEEYANGKTAKASVKAGFKRALITILDSNVTTVLAAIVLWILCSGSIKGFAITLFLGVLVSMFTAVLITRWLIKVVGGLVSDEKQDRFFRLRRRDA